MMSGRCRACNSFLEEFEMVRTWPNSSEYCDLCTDCLNSISDIEDDGDCLQINEIGFEEYESEYL